MDGIGYDGMGYDGIEQYRIRWDSIHFSLVKYSALISLLAETLYS